MQIHRGRERERERESLSLNAARGEPINVYHLLAARFTRLDTICSARCNRDAGMKRGQWKIEGGRRRVKTHTGGMIETYSMHRVMSCLSCLVWFIAIVNDPRRLTITLAARVRPIRLRSLLARRQGICSDGGHGYRWISIRRPVNETCLERRW